MFASSKLPEVNKSFEVKTPEKCYLSTFIPNWIMLKWLEINLSFYLMWYNGNTDEKIPIIHPLVSSLGIHGRMREIIVLQSSLFIIYNTKSGRRIFLNRLSGIYTFLCWNMLCDTSNACVICVTKDTHIEYMSHKLQ